MEQKLHTPEGVRDIYSRECEIKLTLQKKLNQVLHLYGYRDIQTPTFEYYDVFREEIGSTSTQELYKFFDREIYWLFVRTLLHRLQGRRLHFLILKIFRFVFVMSETLLSIIQAIAAS